MVRFRPLFTPSSKRVPGKKYPQPVDTYIGLITPEGVIYSHKKKISVANVEVWEYGFSKAMLDLCPPDWKKPLGNDWKDVLTIMIKKWSPTTYLGKDKQIKTEEDYPYQFSAQMTSLNRRFYQAYGRNIKDLDILKTIYLVVTEEMSVISKISESQKELLDAFSLEMEV